AGLVGYAAWRCALRGPHAAQYVGDLPIGRGVEEGSGCLRHRLSFGSVAQNLNLAAIGQSCIELDEIAQGDAGTAEADGKPRRLVDGQGRPDANLVEAGHEPRRTDRVQYADCWYVQRQLKRLANSDVTLVVHVEILGPIAVEVGGAVGDHCLLCNQSLLECQAVNEWFQRRPGRPLRAGHGDPS